MIAVTIELEKHTAGTTWQGISSIGPIKFSVNGGAETDPPAPCELAWMQFRRGTDKGPLLASFSTDPNDPQLPITSYCTGNVWEFAVPEVAAEDFPATAGNYHWAFFVKDTDGIVWPLYEGIQEVESSPVVPGEMVIVPEEPTP